MRSNMFALVAVLYLAACANKSPTEAAPPPSARGSIVAGASSGYSFDRSYADSFRVEFASGHFAQFKDIYGTNGFTLFNHNGDGLIIDNPAGNREVLFSLGGEGIANFYNVSASERGLYVAGRVTAPAADVDTIYANSALIIKFADGNELQFVSTGSGVIVAGKANGVTSNLAFSSSGQASIGATSFRAATQYAGFYDAPNDVVRQTVTGSRGNNAALTQLLAKLNNLGIITNSTTN